MKKHLKYIILCLLSLALLLTGCNGGIPAETDTDTATESATETESTTDGETETDDCRKTFPQWSLPWWQRQKV